jgi:hypothetical protein
MSLLPSRTFGAALPLLLAMLLLSVVGARADAAPSLVAQPSAQDFGTLNVDWGEQTTYISVQNTGADPVTLGASTIDGSGGSVYRVSSDGCLGQMLAPGTNCNVGVGFDPVDMLTYDATLHVDAAGANLAVPLTGVGGVQRGAATPDALDFGGIALGASATRSFAIASTGNLPLQLIVALPTSGDVGAFRVVTDGCSMHTLTPATTCTLRVRFEPLAAGAAQATLTLIRGDGAPLQVALRGDGRRSPAPVVPDPPVAPAAVAFGWTAGSPAPFAHDRIDLGIARCVRSAHCSVTVRPRIFTAATSTARAGRVRGRTVVWRPGHRLRVALALPARLHGTPVLLVATLRTHAAGRPASTRTIVVALVAGRRHGSVIVTRGRRGGGA